MQTKVRRPARHPVCSGSWLCGLKGPCPLSPHLQDRSHGKRIIQGNLSLRSESLGPGKKDTVPALRRLTVPWAE